MDPVARQSNLIQQATARIHHLEVIMANDNMDWNGITAVLSIHVTPPFWLSTPAYISYFVLLLGLIAYLITQEKKRHRMKMAKQRKEIEASKQHEMDETKLHFFTNVSHDLRTPLSLIITPIERIMALPEQINEHAKEDLELIYRNALLLMNEMNQLLDLRKLEKGENTLQTSYEIYRNL